MNQKTLYTRVAKTLRDARDKMNDSGKHWTQGTLAESILGEIGVMRYCSIGGINAALDVPQVYVETTRLIREDEPPDEDADDEERALAWAWADGTKDVIDVLDVLDATKLLLADVIIGNPPEAVTSWYLSTETGVEQINEAESIIIRHNDQDATFDESSGGSLSQKVGWAIVEAKFMEAADAADKLAA